MVPFETIERYAKTVGESFSAHKVILFGSYAYGNPSEHSDVDLMVVMDTDKQPWEAASEIRARHRAGFPMDLLVRTPAQLDERLGIGDLFMGEIVNRGKVLYESSHGGMGGRGRGRPSKCRPGTPSAVRSEP